MADGPSTRRVLLLGGARSGKSAAAEAMAARAAHGGPVTYVATAESRPQDEEWAARIAAHRARRPPHWRTVETADPAPALAAGGVVLVDCLALWLTRAMDAVHAWDDAAWAATAPDELSERVNALVAAWSNASGTVIGVSNEVGMGVVPATPAGRRFRDELGRLNVRLAAAADEVYLVVAGRLLPLAAATEA
jgi:adenosylcobinamide kinase/adenosylcobinamide-phosphate guanylyltransferase